MLQTTRRSATLALTMEQRLARCATPMTKWQLFNALASRNPIISINGIAVILSAIQREDGSGNTFNLTVYKDGTSYKCFVRCQDAA